MSAEAGRKTVHLKDYQPPSWCVNNVFLRFLIGDDGVVVESDLHLSRSGDKDVDELRLYGVDLELLSVEVDSVAVKPSDFRYEGEELIIGNLPSGDFVFRSRVRIQPELNTALEGLYASGGMYCTQCEAEGFRKITFYPDRPDVLSRFTTTIEADKDRFPILLANGNLVAEGDLANGRHYATWEDPFPKPSYLFALVAGRLECRRDSFVTMSGREIDLRVYVEPADLEKVAHALSSLKRSMRWDEQVYGREYDLDVFMIVAVSHFNMGAMENKGLNIFNTSCVLAHPSTTTDAGFQRVESVVAHEYFHNWSGNRVTCRDWFQLSLKEGFTVFRDQQFSADMLSASVQRIEDINMLRTWQFPEDAGPLAHPVRPESFVEINNFYTATVYEKGAEIVRMLHAVLGPEQFRKGTDLYFSRHDGQAVTVEDFVAALSDASGVDLEPFLQWYRQPGTPELRADGMYNPEKRQYTLRLSQVVRAVSGFPEPLPVPIPVRIALVGPDGQDMRVCHDSVEATEHVLLLKEHSGEFVFSGVSHTPVPSLLRDFSAPVRLQQSLTEEERLFLVRHDGNGVNRWLMTQDLLVSELVRLVGGGTTVDERLVGAITAMLPDLAEKDAALAAKLLQLPTVHQLMDHMSPPDPDRLHFARLRLRSAVTARLENWFVGLCQQRQGGDYEFNAAAMGRRALVNTAMGYLVDYSPAHASIAVQCFHSATNMTDEAAALVSLVHAGLPEAEACLESFSQRWRHEALVVDQWFAIQATAPLPVTTTRVRQLLRHPAFDRTNPNRVRALLGQYANANPVAFHQAGGEGYLLFCAEVGGLDGINPQIAARLLGALSVWPRLDDQRRECVRTALAQLSGRDLSPDLGETYERLMRAGLAEGSDPLVLG